MRTCISAKSNADKPALQLDLPFEPAPASPSPLIGLRVELQRPCSTCGEIFGVIGPSAAMHANRVTCAGCGIFRTWLSHEAANFIIAVAEKFGAPSSPIVIRAGGQP